MGPNPDRAPPHMGPNPDAADLAAGTATNKWIEDLAPWKMKEESQKGMRASCYRLLLEAVNLIFFWIFGFIF